MHALHPYTHDSLSFIFTLNVITNSPPKLQMKRLVMDAEVNAGSWWQMSIGIDLFKDNEWNSRFASRYVIEIYGQKRT